MNPFEKIDELKLALRQEATTKGVQPEDSITWMEHYKRMLNMLAVIEHELETAEYNYVVSSLDGSQIKVFGDITIKQEQLSDGLLIFTPMAVNDEELNSIDMNSLYDILTQLRDSGKITQDIIVLPPYVNVFKARLAWPGEEEDPDTDEDENEGVINAWDAIEEDKARQRIVQQECESWERDDWDHIDDL